MTTSPQSASGKPKPAPTKDSIVPSIRSWRTIRQRLAPRANRSAISAWREAPRANCRLATFAQASNSRNNTAAVTTDMNRAAYSSTVSRSNITSTPRPPFVNGNSLDNRMATVRISA